MAPTKDVDKPKDRIDMIADISKTGKLVESGCDPFTRAPENKAMATQTEGSGAKGVLQDAGPPSEARNALELILANKDVVKSTDSPASQVLRLVVGMLGMEVHEEPSPWAESWLTFQDQTLSSLGLGSKKSPRKESDVGKESPQDWQMRVLDHLRQHVESRTRISTSKEFSETNTVESGHDWGPDFPEHLNLAEFALRRIAYAVGVLEDPEKHDRPILLREYTEEMVLKVAKDLRQWLQQLGSLLGLYHVHLLDLEAERRKLAKLLEAQQAKFSAGEEERRKAVGRHGLLQSNWEEDKMRRDAERLLGIKCAGDDVKIYSQKDVDEMYRKWEQENLDPLMQELKELRIAREGLADKLRNQGKHSHHGHAQDTESSAEPAMGKAMICQLVGIIDSVNERVFDDPLNRQLLKLAEDLAKGGHNLADILARVNSLPIKDPADAERGLDLGLAGPAGEAEHPAMKCLDAMASEFDKLEVEARGCPIQNGSDKLSFLAAWARDSTAIVRGSLADGGTAQLRWLPPPKWDLGILSKRQAATGPLTGPSAKDPSEAAFSGDAEGIRRELEDEFERKMKRLRRELEAQIREAAEVAERERLNAQDALERLAEESAKADATLAELRRKIQMLEALLREKGLGKQAADAIWGAGLSEFMQGRDVFERLYRDALDRMRRSAETQARHLEESSMDFLRTVGQIMDPHFKLPGLDTSILDHMEQPSGLPSHFRQGSTPPSTFWMPRSAGGTMPTGTPPRSRSPVGSPSHASRPSPRPVQSAPCRMTDPLSVARLLTPSLLAATPIATKSQRNEPANRLQTASSVHALQRPPMQRGRESLDVGLSISSTATPPLAHDGGMRRPMTQQYSVSQLATKTRSGQQHPSAASRSDGFKMLPPLECKGQGRSGSSRSPSNDEMEARQVSRLRGVRTGSPVREVNSTDKQRLERTLLGSNKDGGSNKEPLLTIGSLRSGGGPPPPSGLLPPEMRHEPRIPTAKVSVGRLSTHNGVGKMPRQGQGGSLSMPHLGPPRLLVQSVGAAY